MKFALCTAIKSPFSLIAAVGEGIGRSRAEHELRLALKRACLAACLQPFTHSNLKTESQESSKISPRFLKSGNKRGKAVLVFNSFRLDVANASPRRGVEAIVLMPRAFNVLGYLVERPGQLVTKQDLWPGIAVTDATLTVYVSELRKALGDEPIAQA
jgi:DNA-binding response OmpR family regulator